MQKPPAPRRFGIGHLALMIAGVTFGFWLFGMMGPNGTLPPFGPNNPGPPVSAYGVWIGVLGGLSFIGPPLLLLARRRERRRFGPGELLWFTQGTSAWLLWPPVVFYRSQGHLGSGTNSGICFAYGTPLMALYLGSALLFGGWIRKGRRRSRSWREKFGLILGILWACTGGYCLWLIWGSR